MPRHSRCVKSEKADGLRDSFIQRLLERRRMVGQTKLCRPVACAAVRGNFVVFDFLGRSD